VTNQRDLDNRDQIRILSEIIGIQYDVLERQNTTRRLFGSAFTEDRDEFERTVFKLQLKHGDLLDKEMMMELYEEELERRENARCFTKIYDYVENLLRNKNGA
jgi:hypothetical protein